MNIPCTAKTIGCDRPGDPRTYALWVENYTPDPTWTKTGNLSVDFHWSVRNPKMYWGDGLDHKHLRIVADSHDDAVRQFVTTHKVSVLESLTTQRCYEWVCDYICIEDFCGYESRLHLPISYGANYHISANEVRFWGAWCKVPPMPSDTIPTEDAVNAWVVTHNPTWLEDYQNGSN